ncbi:type III-A CRISPR-associated RAMP protein Csm3 [Brachyspira intermedia]|uniref:type III-A CRISPR-associated RAMP protein Csm3 n=1 Tax=Brachyspira intermedia TaxID=84377 RepID=UPI003004E2A9
MGALKTIKYKFLITSKIELITGMHIGGSSDFSPIGAIDSPVVKDPLTKQPIIPGSSIKGKLRSLLARMIVESYNNNSSKLPEHNGDHQYIKELFGAQNEESKLQFYDLFLSNDSAKEIKKNELDFDFTEIKFENTIKRNELSANPRQLERVPAGAVFEFKVIYNFTCDDARYEDNFKLLYNAIKALEFDYLGGSGSRGYGRVKFKNFNIETVLKNCNVKDKIECIDENLEDGKEVKDKFEEIFKKYIITNEEAKNIENKLKEEDNENI